MPATSQPTKRYVYLLAGQSNMDGYGLVSELPEELKEAQANTWIYNPNRREDQAELDDRGFWEVLKPGHGTGYSTDGIRGLYSAHFGIELTFAKKMKELAPDRNICLFKYAKGGSSIHPDAAGDWGCWDPDFRRGNRINQWRHFEFHYRRAMQLLGKCLAENEVIVPAGILWLQGESDASHPIKIALTYHRNLERLLARMRQLTGNPDLPVVIARITESNLGENGSPVLSHARIVQKAQKIVAETNANMTYIEPPDWIGWSDPWHYDSKTYMELGRRFAEVMGNRKIGK